ncbi:chemotaxis protein CheA [Fangia hongkongensis]|uniref:chemotaxis protein CheA n=3 Tax=Fangia hongkongensis TaxID=270495 RepID=UPI000373FB77|nr:ATP-binding protein [Fangia hongkongensis]
MIDQRKYKEDYLRESKAHISAFESLVLSLEEKFDANIINKLFHHAHTLKGISSMMGYRAIEKAFHKIEDDLNNLEPKKLPSSFLIEKLLLICDFFQEDLSLIRDEKEPIYVKQFLEIIDSQDSDKLDQARDYLLNKSLKERDSHKEITISLKDLDSILALSQKLFVMLESEGVSANLQADVGSLETLGLAKRLRESVFQLRMRPLIEVFLPFKRTVRELAKLYNKEIELELIGGEVRVDHMLFDVISECLVHLVRNAIAHGIEPPETRVSQGKNKVGLITLKAYYDQDAVKVAVIDDGQGIDIQKLKAKYHKNTEKLTEKELIDHLFDRMSTAEKVDEVHGRGVGLGIVKSSIQSIAGNVTIAFKKGQFCQFILTLPTTMALLKVLMVKQNHQYYFFPARDIWQLAKIPITDIVKKGDQYYAKYDVLFIPLLLLCDLFSMPRKQDGMFWSIVIIKINNQFIGIVVEQCLTINEVLVKPLHKLIVNTSVFSGVSMVHSGEFALVIDSKKLLTKANAFQREAI